MTPSSKPLSSHHTPHAFSLASLPPCLASSRLVLVRVENSSRQPHVRPRDFPLSSGRAPACDLVPSTLPAWPSPPSGSLSCFAVSTPLPLDPRSMFLVPKERDAPCLGLFLSLPMSVPPPQPPDLSSCSWLCTHYALCLEYASPPLAWLPPAQPLQIRLNTASPGKPSWTLSEAIRVFLILPYTYFTISSARPCTSGPHIMGFEPSAVDHPFLQKGCIGPLPVRLCVVCGCLVSRWLNGRVK